MKFKSGNKLKLLQYYYLVCVSRCLACSGVLVGRIVITPNGLMGVAAARCGICGDREEVLTAWNPCCRSIIAPFKAHGRVLFHATKKSVTTSA